MLFVDMTIPNLTAPDQNGQNQTLHSLLGKQGGIFYFYPKDNTPGCTLEANDFQNLSQDFLALGYRIIGISKDSIKSHANFCSKHGLEFTLLSDTNGTICTDFGVWQKKIMCGKTSMGIVRTTFVTDALGVIRKIYPNVKTKDHAKQVLTDIGSA